MKSEDKIILGMIIGFIVFFYLRKIIVRYKKKGIYYKAKRAEQKAIALLEKENYKVIEVQPKKDIFYYLNGELKKGYVNADFMVRKNFRKMVCEVKTGEKTRVAQASIRRQLLDYYYAYGVKEVLLVDMEKEKIDKIRFKNDRRGIYLAVLVAFLLLNLFNYLYGVGK